MLDRSFDRYLLLAWHFFQDLIDSVLTLRCCSPGRANHVVQLKDQFGAQLEDVLRFFDHVDSLIICKKLLGLFKPQLELSLDIFTIVEAREVPERQPTLFQTYPILLRTWPEVFTGSQHSCSDPPSTREDGHVETPRISHQCPRLLMYSFTDVRTECSDFVAGILGQQYLEICRVQTKKVL